MKKSVCCILLLVLFLMGCNAPENNNKNPEEPENVLSVVEMPVSTPEPTVTPTVPPTETPTPTVTPTPMPDVEVPVVTLLGEECMELQARKEFVEPGFTAFDAVDGDISEKVEVTGSVDVNLCGTYLLTYCVSDAAGNSTKAERTVIVKQPDVVIPEGKVIYLTFDDGPGKYTDKLLEILAKYDVKATFFTCVNGQPKMVTKIHEAGHTVAIHCRNHDYNKIYASEEAYFDDLFYMQDAIYECTGVRTTMVRFPGGSSNQASSFNPGIMTRLTEQVEQIGFQYFDWNVSSSDTRIKDTEQILENMISGVKNRNYSIILQHAEVKEHSVNAVEDFIIWALENGYRFLALDETSPRAYHRVAN